MERVSNGQRVTCGTEDRTRVPDAAARQLVRVRRAGSASVDDTVPHDQLQALIQAAHDANVAQRIAGEGNEVGDETGRDVAEIFLAADQAGGRRGGGADQI